MSHRPISVGFVYNRYLNRGGEDECFESEADLLESRDCRVFRITEQVEVPANFKGRLSLAIGTFWSQKWYRWFCEHLRQEKIDLVHVHNLHPNFSPSILYACHTARIPVVQTLHNFRLVCPNGSFFRDNHICEDCLGRVLPWPGVLHACYHNSTSQTAVIAGSSTLHRLLETWKTQIDTYITVSEFVRRKFTDAGFDAGKIMTKPNFLAHDPGTGTGSGDYALFVGRLSLSKGIETLLSTWKQINGRLTLKIVGDGPLAEVVRNASEKIPAIEYSGRQPKEKVYELMKNAKLIVIPSACYETFGLVAIEGFACGVPIVASQIGALAELIADRRAGLYFRPGDPDDLAEKVTWLLDHPAELAQMRKEARAEYEAKYTAERNYEMLMNIYQRAIEQNRASH